MQIRTFFLLLQAIIVGPLMIFWGLSNLIAPDKAIQHAKSWYKFSNRNLPGIKNDPEKLDLLLKEYEKTKLGKIMFSRKSQIIVGLISLLGGILGLIGTIWLYKRGQL